MGLDGVLTVVATQHEQQHVECFVHALSHFRVARERGLATIRVEKPGHSCEYPIAALIDWIERRPRSAPRALITLTQAEQATLGTTYDTWDRNWPGAVLVGGD